MSGLRLPDDAPQELLDALDESGIEVEGDEDGGPMTAEEFQGVVQAAVADAVDYIDDDISEQRIKAMNYYRGRPFGNEVEGRSRVVMTEVRDTVQAVLPSLLRVFTQGQNAVEFMPRTESKVQQAEQATDYVNFVFFNDNPGFRILWDSFKDALILKTGTFKWWTKTSTRIYEESYSGLEEGQVNYLAQQPGVEILGSSPEAPGAVDPETGQPAPPSFSVLIRRSVDEKRQVVECIPPEEFIIARNARDLDSADFVGHRSLKTMSELIEMGFDEEEIEEHGSATGTLEFNEEEVVRNPDLELVAGKTQDSADETMHRYLFIEGYIRADKDGDGIAELRRVCCINDNCHILHDEVVDEVKLAIICPDPEAHLVIGSSLADQVMDLQEIKSNVVRNTLDSLAQVIHPRTAVVEGQVNMDDVLNDETGGIIRMTTPGAVQELAATFVGQQAMPIIAWLDDVRAARTGISKASQGLDPDVLQSTTAAAVTNTMAAAEQRLEMIARIFAETGIRRLFTGLLREICRNQDKPRMVKLRDQWVNVDPRDWDADMDVIVNVGLGNGGLAAQSQMLMQAIAKQEQILQTQGLNNPLVDIKQYRDAMVKLLNINGIKDGSSYFKAVTPEVLEQASQPPQPQPDPAQMLAKVEADKIQKDMKIADQKMAVEIATQKAKDDLERDKLDADVFIRLAEIQAKYGAQVQIENVYAMIQRNRDTDRANVEKMRVEQAAQHQAAQRDQAAQLAQQKMAQQPAPEGVQ